MLGKINWYDKDSGKGSIIGDDGIWYRISQDTKLEHFSIDYMAPGAKVVFSLANTSVHPIVTKLDVLED